MKKTNRILSIVLAMVLCIGALTACTGDASPETKPPVATKPDSDKNEQKPTQQPTQKPEEATKPEVKPEEKPEETPEATAPEAEPSIPSEDNGSESAE